VLLLNDAIVDNMEMNTTHSKQSGSSRHNMKDCVEGYICKLSKSKSRGATLDRMDSLRSVMVHSTLSSVKESSTVRVEDTNNLSKLKEMRSAHEEKSQDLANELIVKMKQHAKRIEERLRARQKDQSREGSSSDAEEQRGLLNKVIYATYKQLTVIVLALEFTCFHSLRLLKAWRRWFRAQILLS
jgi:hypothetical protein